MILFLYFRYILNSVNRTRQIHCSYRIQFIPCYNFRKNRRELSWLETLSEYNNSNSSAHSVKLTKQYEFLKLLMPVNSTSFYVRKGIVAGTVPSASSNIHVCCATSCSHRVTHYMHCNPCRTGHALDIIWC